jgi:hypothetical protein
MSDRKPGQRPPHVKPPAHLSKSPPLPTPAPAKPDAEHGGRGGLDPVRYGDWEINGLAIDF